MTAVPRLGRLVLLFALALTLMLARAAAQSTITRPANNFSASEDIKLGAEATAVIHQQLPMLRDGHVDVYVDKLAGRLADAIPTSLRQRAFVYDMGVLDIDEVISFALPGGPLFISRGMIELATRKTSLRA